MSKPSKSRKTSRSDTPDVNFLYGISEVLLTLVTGAGASTVRRWKAHPDKVPEPARRLIELVVNGNLGEVDRAFRGWRIIKGHLVSPDGNEFSTGEIQAIPFRRAQLQNYQLAQRLPAQADWVAGQWREAPEYDEGQSA